MKVKYLKYCCVIVAIMVMVYVFSKLSVAYEASCGFYYGLQTHLISGGYSCSFDCRNGCVDAQDTLNVLLQNWRSDRVKKMVFEIFRDRYPNIPITAEELCRDVARVQVEQVEKKRAFQIRVRSRVSEVCKGIANAYVEAIQLYTDQENRIQNDKAVVQLHDYAGHFQRKVAEIRKKMTVEDGDMVDTELKKELEVQLKKEVEQLEKLRRKEKECRKSSEDYNMSVVFAWRAKVSKQLVFE